MARNTSLSTQGTTGTTRAHATTASEGPREIPTAAPPDTSWSGLLKGAVIQWLAHKDARLGAALAYYSVFSIGPLIVIIIAIAGLVFGADAVRSEVTGGMKGLLGM